MRNAFSNLWAVVACGVLVYALCREVGEWWAFFHTDGGKEFLAFCAVCAVAVCCWFGAKWAFGGGIWRRGLLEDVLQHLVAWVCVVAGLAAVAAALGLVLGAR